MLMILSSFITAPCTAQMNYEGAVTVSRNGKSFTFSSIAVQNLKVLREVAVDMGADVHIPTLQAIMMTETHAGTGGSIGLPRAHPTRRSYGWMQLTIPTARVLFRDLADLRMKYFGERVLKSVKDAEIKKLLLTDCRLNVRLGILLYVQYLDMVKKEWARAVAGYNMGIGNALKRAHAPKSVYVVKVRNWIPLVTAMTEEVTKAEQIVLVAYSSTLPENWLGIKGTLQGEQDGQKEQKAAETFTRAECYKSCQ